MTGTDLIRLPDGQVVDYNDPSQVARAMDDLRKLKQQANEIIAEFTERLLELSRAEGKQTIDLPDGIRVTISKRVETIWDVEHLERGLREAGMSDERISEIITPEVTYKVNGAEAKRAAGANPAYAEVVAAAQTRVERRPSVSVTV